MDAGLKPTHTAKTICLIALLTFFGASDLAAQDILFSATQAERGEQRYTEHCLVCHGAELQGVNAIPDLKGENFRTKWAGRSLTDYVKVLATMPPGNAQVMSRRDHIDLLSYILQANGFPSGDEDMPNDLEYLADARLPEMTSGSSDFELTAQDENIRDILVGRLNAASMEQLTKPSPANWPSPRRSLNADGYSPLSQINRESVGDLEPAWQVALPAGENMTTPLVQDGVMFVYTAPHTVLALDARDGKLLWKYVHGSRRPWSRKLGLSLYKDVLLVPTSDLKVIALDFKTGQLRWESEITIEGFPAGDAPASLRSPPLVAKGKVIQGVTSPSLPGGAFTIAFDVETGEESWRLYSIARPGEYGGETWNGLPLEKRSGGSVWDHLTYDEDLNLVFFGIAPTYDTAPLVTPVEKPGISSEALYTNATMAVRPKTGELVWYFQHMPNDQWDLDWVFERHIVEMDVDGSVRKVVVASSKLGLFDILDAETGSYLYSLDPGIQNLVDRIDPETGKKHLASIAHPDVNATSLLCPFSGGARSWTASSFDPTSGLLYVPMYEICGQVVEEGTRMTSNGVAVVPAPLPNSTDKKVGRLQALDIHGQKLSWNKRFDTAIVSSAMATGGKLVFAGDLKPSLKALDAMTGEVVWETALPDAPSSGLITYAVDGKQYVSVVVGQTNALVNAAKLVSDQFAQLAGRAPRQDPGGGAAIVTFALTDRD